LNTDFQESLRNQLQSLMWRFVFACKPCAKWTVRYAFWYAQLHHFLRHNWCDVRNLHYVISRQRKATIWNNWPSTGG